jgi:hypothetical protein
MTLPYNKKPSVVSIHIFNHYGFNGRASTLEHYEITDKELNDVLIRNIEPRQPNESEPKYQYSETEEEMLAEFTCTYEDLSEQEKVIYNLKP